MYKQTRYKDGMVAIMVTAVIMVIMSLITLGFARMVQREQRQGLDNQLSAQAFYAAESGINAVSAFINASGTPATPKSNCDVASFGNGVIDPATPEVRFTCLMYDPEPEELEANNGAIKPERSKVIPINARPNAQSLTFSWGDNNPSRTNFDNTCTGVNRNIPADDWGAANRIGMLQIDLIPVHNGASAPQIERNILDQETATVLMYPCGASGANSVDIENYRAGVANDTGADRGKAVGANCTGAAPYPCSLSITNLPTNVDFYARIKSIYGDLNLQIEGETSSGNRTSFANAQVVVDSTGRANDVLRRLQVRLPIYEEYRIPEATVQSQDGVCKLYSITGTAVSSDILCN
ncbi:MAG: pilus assembly PilX N-terminal domain-containing protein [bacterium]|nr:pilus assembly PilX N-terminal domain-containing protein [bacterium]